MPPEAFRLPPGTPARPEALEAVHELLAQAWSSHPDVTAADRMSIETAIVELAANIVEHAGGVGELGLEVDVCAERVEARFDDTGTPFEGDLGSADLPEDEMSERGRGLALARALSDELAYERDGRTNRWRVVRLRAR